MVAARLSSSPQCLHAMEDIAQSVLMGVNDRLPELKNRTVSGLKAFTSTIVSRRVADYLRGRPADGAARRPVASLDSTVAGLSGAGPMWQFLSADGTSPLTAADRAEQLNRVLAELGRLKPEHRDVITYAFFDQLTTAEIAERMGISRPATSMLLIRAVNTLRRRLATAGGATPHENTVRE